MINKSILIKNCKCKRLIDENDIYNGICDNCFYKKSKKNTLKTINKQNYDKKLFYHILNNFTFDFFLYETTINGLKINIYREIKNTVFIIDIFNNIDESTITKLKNIFENKDIKIYKFKNIDIKNKITIEEQLIFILNIIYNCVIEPFINELYIVKNLSIIEFNFELKHYDELTKLKEINNINKRKHNHIFNLKDDIKNFQPSMISLFNFIQIPTIF